jgi:hypothetical protein
MTTTTTHTITAPHVASDADFTFLARKLREALEASGGRRTVTLTVVISPDNIQVYIGDARGQHWRKPK